MEFIWGAKKIFARKKNCVPRILKSSARPGSHNTRINLKKDFFCFDFLLLIQRSVLLCLHSF